MRDEDELNEELVHVVEAMLETGRIEGLAKGLRRQFPTLTAFVDDALGTAVEKFIVRSVPPEKPEKYLVAIAYNELKKLFNKKVKELSLNALTEDRDTGHHWDLPDGDWSVEERTQWSMVYEQLRRHVEAWDVENLRVVTLLYLESAYKGEPLSSAEAAELATGILGYGVDDNIVRSWKSRGFGNLQRFVKNNDLDD